MSYGFQIRAADKDDARAKVAAEFDKVVASQPIHAGDRAQAEAAFEGFLGVVCEPLDTSEISVTISGSVSTWGSDLGLLTGAGVNVSVGIVPKS